MSTLNNVSRAGCLLVRSRSSALVYSGKYFGVIDRTGIPPVV